MSGKRCEKCGEIKKSIFKCGRCNKKVCLNCFDFITNMCVDCDVIIYNIQYKKKIESYGVAS